MKESFSLKDLPYKYDALEPVEKIRILVGLSIDRDSYDVMQYHQQNGIIDFESH